jgi:hypothetical protein
MVTRTTTMGEDPLKGYQQGAYPDPHSLPRPPTIHEPRPLLTLSELIPGQYADVAARVVSLKVSERQDQLGTKQVFTGMIEDASFRIPFVSHQINNALITGSVYKFKNAYIHEFEDKGLLLVATEHTRVIIQEIIDWNEQKKFVWEPKIGPIKRPIQNISLTGIISTVHNNSGLVKRCNKCRSLLYEESCPNECHDGWGYDLRISTMLYDGSGSIKMVLTKDVASRILHRNLSELILLASQTTLTPVDSLKSQYLPSTTYSLNIPNEIEVTEAVTENPSTSYRKSDKLIVTDGRNLLFLPTNEEHHFTESNKRILKNSEVEDKKITRRLIEKAIHLNVRRITGKGMLQGIYLLEEPLNLYRCERAKLYVGFSLRVIVKEKSDSDSQGPKVKALVEAVPQAYVRESVLDYIRMRRENGASADSVIRHLTGFRNKAIVAPSGNYGTIVEVMSRRASDQTISDTDSRSLVDFWKQVYDIDIKPEEMPLLKIKMINSESTFTYPPSMVFYGPDSLVINAGLQKLIEDKKMILKSKVSKLMEQVLQDIRIGELKIQFEGDTSHSNNIQSILLQEIKEKLYGKGIKGRGSVMIVHDEPWYFPNQIQFITSE